MASVTPVSMYLAAILCRQTHVPEGQPSGHPFCRCPSWLVGKVLEITVPVLDLEFFHKLNMIVVCDNLFVMRAKILRQNMQQGVLGLLKVNVELLLLFLVQVIDQEGRSRSDPNSTSKGPKSRRSD